MKVKFKMKKSNKLEIIQDNLFSITLQLTKKCSFDCVFCGQSISRKVNKEKSFLNRKKISEILIDAKKLNVKSVNFTGGEPTSRSDLISIINEASSLGLKSNLLTNGFNLNEVFCNKLISAGLNYLTISLHSSNEKNHDLICNMPGSFKKLIKAIKYLKSIKNDLKVRVTYTLHSNNYLGSHRMLALASKLGVDSINFSQIVFSNDMITNNLRLSKEQMKKFYFQIAPLLLRDEIKSNVKVRLEPFFPSLIHKSKVYQIYKLLNHKKSFDKEIDFYLNEDYNCGLYMTLPCAEALRSSRIQANGEVAICCDSEEENLSIGNINNQRFFDIWNSYRYKKLRSLEFYPKSKLCKYCKRDFFKR